MVIASGGKPLSEYGILCSGETHTYFMDTDYIRETSYNQEALRAFIDENEPKLTDEQRRVYQHINRSVQDSSGQIYFLDAPGGTGKTFLIKLLLSRVRVEGKVALAVASSGIAATLLPGGKTAHSMFKLPLELDNIESPVCNISSNSSLAELLRRCSLIIWDECTMSNKKAVEALDRTLQDLRNSSSLMGGITTLFAGDFRQTLPVVTRGTRADEINASLRHSALWPLIQTLHLTQNMRAHLFGDSDSQEFSDLLLKIGKGKFEEQEGQIALPPQLCTMINNIEDLINHVYPGIENIALKADCWLCERAILVATNELAATINSLILEKFSAQKIMYKSVDTVVNQDEAVNYPVEFLNSVTAPGLPAHTISLKVGTPIMLLRNLHPPKLCNGTRLKVTAL